MKTHKKLDLFQYALPDFYRYGDPFIIPLFKRSTLTGLLMPVERVAFLKQTGINRIRFFVEAGVSEGDLKAIIARFGLVGIECEVYRNLTYRLVYVVQAKDARLKKQYDAKLN